jgi:hypothetical protein
MGVERFKRFTGDSLRGGDIPEDFLVAGTSCRESNPPRKRRTGCNVISFWMVWSKIKQVSTSWASLATSSIGLRLRLIQNRIRSWFFFQSGEFWTEFIKAAGREEDQTTIDRVQIKFAWSRIFLYILLSKTIGWYNVITSHASIFDPSQYTSHSTKTQAVSPYIS